LALSLVSLSGCNRGLSDIDAKTQRLLATTSHRVDGGTVIPERTFHGENDKVGATERNKTPGTKNPPASDLTYSVADEARDVAGRLDAYDAQSVPKKSDGSVRINLSEALKTAQRSAPEYLAAEEDYIFVAIRLLIERHLWTPQLFNDTSVGIGGTGTNGSFQSAVTVLNDLKVTQRLPYGGSVQAEWIWQATNQLREQATGRYTQSSSLVLSGTVPLLRGAGYVAQESLIQAERNLVYQARTFEDFRRQFFVSIASQYYQLLQAQSGLRNQEQNVKTLENITAGETARYEAGRIAEFRRNVAQANLLSARATLAGAREAFIVQVEQFKIRLGLASTAAIELIEQELDMPEPETTLDAAVAYALDLRLDLQNRRDQLDDQRRAVANAKNALLPDLNFNASAAVPTDPNKRVGGLSFQPEDLQYQAGVTFGLPLNREQERLTLRQQTIAMARAIRDFNVFRDQLAVGVRQAVRQIDLARFQLTLAEQQVEINKRRVLETELKADEVETQFKVDAANQLQNSEDQRDLARTTLRNAVLDYLRQTGLLRISREGLFERLPGMSTPAAVPAGATPGAGGANPAFPAPDTPPPAKTDQPSTTAPQSQPVTTPPPKP
jgi:outer membrane protein TolC